MDLQLRDTVAVVVGGAQGIGWAIARAFQAEGAAVVVLDRAALSSGPSAEGVQGLVVDVTNYDRLQEVAEKVRSQHGRCDHVIYAAGASSGRFGFPFWNLDPGDWVSVLQINLLGAVHTAHAFAPQMAQARCGTLLFLASVAGQIGSQTDPPYSAAKAGVINFAMCAARDLAAHNVRVNTICPGMVKTALNQSTWAAWNALQPEAEQKTYDDWAAEKIARVTPLNRWQEPEDVAALAVFLASERAKNITGQVLNVDGGQVMHW